MNRYVLTAVAVCFLFASGCAIITGTKEYKRIHVVCEKVQSPTQIVVKRFAASEEDITGEVADARERILNLISLQKESKGAAEVLLTAVQNGKIANPFERFRNEFEEVKTKQSKVLADASAISNALRGGSGPSETWHNQLSQITTSDMPAAIRVVETLDRTKNTPELRDLEELSQVQGKIIDELTNILAPNEKPFAVSPAGLTMPVSQDKIYANTMELLRRLESKELVIEVCAETGNSTYSMIYYTAPHKQVSEYGKDMGYQVLLNHELVRKGYATVDRASVPDEYREAFLSAQDQAAIEGWGIWRLP